jgi:putative membrane protein
MSRFSSSFLESIPKQVASLESNSAVEVVVVAAEESGHYRDVDHELAFVVSMMGLVFLFNGPVEISDTLAETWTVPCAVLFYACGLFIARRLDPIRRLLTTRQRRHQQVLDRARAAFVEERIASTRDRSGLMLFVSGFEREAVFLTDLGVDAVIPAAVFNTIQSSWASCPNLAKLEEQVLAQLPKLAEPLAKALPRRVDDVNELPDEVRLVRS